LNLIDLSTVPDTGDNFTSFLNDLCRELGFDFASYATSHPITGDVQGYANYPDEWKLHYGRRGMHRVDPTLYQSARSIAPVDWNRFTDHPHFRDVFFDAHDFGISNCGLTVPVRGPYGEYGLLSVTRDCHKTEWKKQKRAVIGDLQFAAVHMHDNVMRSGVLQQALRRPSLSMREMQILQWVAAGKSQQDIGDILSISHRTVEVHLRSSREKLCALTTAQAVGRAIGLGLIYPS